MKEHQGESSYQNLLGIILFVPNVFLCLPQEQDGTTFQVPPRVPEPISKCGDLDVIFEYRAFSQKLTVNIVKAQGLPDKDRSGVNTWQIHVVLLPSKKQRGRTSTQRGPNPVFKEKVTFAKLEPRDVSACAVRFRLYAARKMTRERMMGEKLFYLRHLHPEGEMKVTLVLEPRSNISVSMLNGVANHAVCVRMRNCQPRFSAFSL